MSALTQISPGIAVNEIDLTTIVPSVSLTVGAYVGQFNWGPCGVPQFVTNEKDLVTLFGKPTANTTESFNALSFLCCSNFLSYTNSLYVVRTIEANTTTNSCSNANASLLIQNPEEYEFNYELTNSSNAYGPFAAKYPGRIGNSLTISMCANSSAFSSWEYKNYFDNAPGTSASVIERTGNYNANDEMHIIVLDSGGAFSGKANTVLERYSFLSKSSDAVGINGKPSYYKTYLKENSQYIYAMDPPSYSLTSSTWGNPLSETTTYYSPANYTVTLTGGSNGVLASDGQLEVGWDAFKDKDTYEISLAFVGSANVSVAQYVLDNVVLGPESESPTIGRRDTMLFVSPRYEDVVNKPRQQIANLLNDNDAFISVLNRSSSYMVVDSGWKYQYDKYTNSYMWVPLNPDIAGLCAYTDQVADPWYSPGGFNRGRIKNGLKLAWSPNAAERDQIYKFGINPVVSVKGEGMVLMGDKTMQSKPSAFDRINVRRLFIHLEKAISRAARYSLFEFNDEFTRAQFVAMVEPFLRTVKGRRGILDYKVVCDESNNTGDIIDRNAFVGDIYVKPARSINYIQLNFIAVKTAVDFNTIVGGSE